MSKLHSMPFFPAQFFADTEHMRPAASHAYLFLLGHAWIRGAKLANDDHALARMARVSLKAWLAMRDEVLAFWTLGEDGYWRQKRLSQEYDFVSQKVEDNRKNGSLGGQAKAAKKRNEINESGLANATVSPQQPTLTPTLKKDSDSSLRSESPDAGRRAGRATRLPEDWYPNRDQTDYAIAQAVEPERTAADFRDYWLAKAGRDAFKRDWNRTWQQWCRTAADRRAQQHRNRTNGHSRGSLAEGARNVALRMEQAYAARERAAETEDGNHFPRLATG